MHQLVWFVTGCASGFGEAFAHAVLARGDKVIATARNAEMRLVALKEAGAAVLDLDVNAPFPEIEQKIQEAISVYGHVDVLVNNAGVGNFSIIESTTQETYLKSLQTNLFGPANLSRALLPHFRSRKSGIIAFTNSIYSWVSTIAASPYALGKHALAGYATTLQAEVSQFGIEVVSFDIGHFRTGFIGGMGWEGCEIDEYGPMIDGLLGMLPVMDGKQPGDVEKGVGRMIDVLKKEGFAKGKEIPLRLPIGADAMEIVRGKCKEMLKVCDDWEELIASTDREGPKEGLWAEAQNVVPGVGSMNS